jgi:hypothetical protein
VSLVKPALEPSPQAEGERTRGGTRVQWLVYACYLLGAVLLTWRLWADPAGRFQVGDFGDVDQFSWFMRYSATAVSHGHLPAFVTTAMNAPHGVNLLWNTSFLLPGMVLTPVTLLAGPQVSLTVALTLGFAGSAASLFYVLRRWGASISAAALGGALYGFSPAMVNSGIGHYHLQFAVLPPLIIDALLRIVTGRGHCVRTGIWLGLLTAAQLFIGTELLVETAVAAVVLMAVLAISRPRDALAHARFAIISLATGAAVALVLCGRALWVQFHGQVPHASPYSMLRYVTHPYAFVTPSSAMLFHTSGTAADAARYPESQSEYLAYLGVPLLLLLIVAAIIFWRQQKVRVTAVTFVVLELFTLGGGALVWHGFRYPGALLPWHYLEHLPVFSAALPDRFSILADGAAGALLAFAIDRARALAPDAPSWRSAGRVAMTVAVLALLTVVSVPYQAANVAPLPDGWRPTFAALRLAPDARVLVVPVPYSPIPEPMRWYADTGEPGAMIGGTFIGFNRQGKTVRGGRAGRTRTVQYIDELWMGSASARAPSRARINADLKYLNPAAVVAVTSQDSPVARFLTGLFGPPAYQNGGVLAWRR